MIFLYHNKKKMLFLQRKKKNHLVLILWVNLHFLKNQFYH